MKKKLPLIFLIFLVLIMVVVWSKALKKPKKRTGPEAKASQNIAKENKDIVLWGDRSVKKRIRSGFKDLGRDPFSLGEESASLADLSLIGILWDESYPQAIINGEIVKAGDNVNNNKVLEIKKDRVILSDGKKKVELKLWNEPDAGLNR